MIKMAVLYHGNCADGFGAAWAAYRKLGEQDILYRAINYNEPFTVAFKDIPLGIRVYMLDFSFNRADTEYIKEHWNLFLLDHHKTASENLKNLPNCTFDLTHSGAYLAWRYFHDTSVPVLLNYIQDRDMWWFKMHKSREVSAALQSYPSSFKTWDMLNTDVERLMKEGTSIIRFKNAAVERMCKQAFVRSFDGVQVIACNATAFASEMGEQLLKLYPGAKISATYRDLADRKSRVWQLRSRPGTDCSVLAKEMGGGGHAQAAGFVEKL